MTKKEKEKTIPRKSCHFSNICKSLVSDKKYPPPPPLSTPAFRGSRLLTPITKYRHAFPFSHDMSTICAYRYYKLDGTSTARSRNDASVIEQFYKPKQKKFFKFKFNCNPLTGSQNIVITSNFSYTYITL